MAQIWSTSKNSPNSNRMIRFDNDDEIPETSIKKNHVGEKRWSSDVEGPMYVIDKLLEYLGQDPIQWYKYDTAEHPVPPWELEPAGDQAQFRLAYSVTAALTGIVGLDSMVRNQYEEVVLALFRQLDVTYASRGLLPRLTGVDSYTNNVTVTKDAGVYRNVFDVPFIIGTGGPALDFPDDEQANGFRLKITILTLHDDRVKCWDMFAAMWADIVGNPDGVSGNTVGDENLLCEARLRDENRNLLTGATAIFSRSPQSYTEIFVAFGPNIRRYDHQLKPAIIDGTSYQVTASGNITALAIVPISGPEYIYYLSGGLLRRIKDDGSGDEPIVVQIPVYLDITFVEITGFTDMLVQEVSGLWLKKGDIAYVISSPSSTATTFTITQVEDVESSADRLVSVPMLTALRRYGGTSPTLNPNHIGVRVLNATGGGVGKVLNKYNVEIDGSYRIFKIVDLDTSDITYGAFSASLSIFKEILGGPPGEDRDIRRIVKLDTEALKADEILNNPQILLNLFNTAFFFTAAVGNAGATVQAYVYTGAWPPTATAGDFNAVGSIIGSYSVGSFSGLTGAVFSGSWHELGADVYQHIRAADDFLYIGLRISSGTVTRHVPSVDPPNIQDVDISFLSLSGNHS